MSTYFCRISSSIWCLHSDNRSSTRSTRRICVCISSERPRTLPVSSESRRSSFMLEDSAVLIFSSSRASAASRGRSALRRISLSWQPNFSSRASICRRTAPSTAPSCVARGAKAAAAGTIGRVALCARRLAQGKRMPNTGVPSPAPWPRSSPPRGRNWICHGLPAILEAPGSAPRPPEASPGVWGAAADGGSSSLREPGPLAAGVAGIEPGGVSIGGHPWRAALRAAGNPLQTPAEWMP
mmetsp:Transcript_41778/g.130544  ORF Transcript_41778/g.130544 Transcript_41778/m.130544 type:complete len:239 (+) Transcript_41778:887-1603(+)